MKNEFIRTVLFGMAAGIIATVVMDIFVAVAMLAMGNPVSFMFSFIGDVAAAFFSRLSVSISGGALGGSCSTTCSGLVTAACSARC